MEHKENGGCYPSPLNLESDDGKHFLECEIINKEGRVQLKHWNKNEGDLQNQLYYKGKHAFSVGMMSHKTGAIMGIDRHY